MNPGDMRVRRRSFTSGAMASVLSVLTSPARSETDATRKLSGMLISGFRGVSPGDPEVDQILRYLEEGSIAGVLILKRNVRSPEQLVRLTSAFRDAAGATPPIISIDQEGGTISRLGPENGFLSWMSAAEIARDNPSEDEVLNYYAERALEMARVGINLNFAPVVDLNLNPANPIVGALGRSFGASPEPVIRLAAAFVRAHRMAGVATCLKHFPGHGSSSVDSHVGIADISQTWSPEELEPFRVMVDAGLADMIMTGHLLLASMTDHASRPTSLSDRAISLIRNDIGFRGPIVTDDMQMGAITTQMDAAGAAIDAVNAGNSLLIYSNYKKSQPVETAMMIGAALEDAARSGAIDLTLAQAQLEIVHGFRLGLGRP